MPRRELSIHRTILIRLLPAWLFLSLVMGGAAAWLESRRVDQYVFDLAFEAAGRLNLAGEPELFRGNAGAHLTGLKTLMRDSHFAGMRLYDQDRKPLLVVWDQPDPALASAFLAQQPVFPAPGAHHHEALRAGGRMAVLAMVSLTNPGGKPFGYFEGAYVVPPRAVAAIRARIHEALWIVLIVTTLTALTLYPVMVSLNRDTIHLSKGLLESVVELMRVLGTAIANRDSDTDRHNYRVTLYAVQLAERLGQTESEIAPLIAGAFLHDVGKIGVPDGILLKAGKLTREEFEIMKTHVAIGEDNVQDSTRLFRAQDIISSHHERFDGTGYPKGLRGEGIPYNARIFAIADVFDALTSERPYKPALPLDEALELMRKDSGRHFDPSILAGFEQIARPCLEQIGALDSEDLKAALAVSIHTYFMA